MFAHEVNGLQFISRVYRETRNFGISEPS